MVTETGIAHCANRLLSCPDADALRRVWEGLSPDYQRVPDLQSIKDRLKEAFAK